MFHHKAKENMMWNTSGETGETSSIRSSYFHTSVPPKQRCRWVFNYERHSTLCQVGDPWTQKSRNRTFDIGILPGGHTDSTPAESICLPLAPRYRVDFLCHDLLAAMGRWWLGHNSWFSFGQVRGASGIYSYMYSIVGKDHGKKNMGLLDASDCDARNHVTLRSQRNK